MKKCPKCGTILDDSKKTCYMCGTNLNQASFSHFGDTFDSQLGATTSENQDNVFGKQKELNPFSKEDVKENQDNTTFMSQEKVHFFNENVNNLNELERDKKSSSKNELDNILNDKEEFKNKKDAIRE